MGRPKRWNLLRAAALGAIVGLVFGTGRTFIEHQGAPMEYLVGAVIGGIVGGGVLFGIAAGARNLLLKAE